MKFRSSLLFVISCIALIMTSCVGTNAVTNGHGIQKRKYTRGFYLEQRGSTASLKKDASAETKEMAWNDLAHSETTENQVPNTLSNIEEGYTEEHTISETPLVASTAVESEPIKTERSNHLELSRRDLAPSKGIKRFKHIKENVKQLKNHLNSQRRESGAMLVLLVILCLILPPLAVGIFEGITTRFWIDLILWIIGWGVGFWLLGGLGWIASVVAVIYALLIVLSVI